MASAGSKAYRYGVAAWYDTVTRSSLLYAKHRGGARDYVIDYSEAVLNRSRRLTLVRIGKGTGMDNPGNAATRGGVTGIFLYSWSEGTRHGGPWGYRRVVRNFASHALYVEEGRSLSTKNQAFSWVKARNRIRRKQGRAGGYILDGPAPPGKVLPYRRTAARRGHHILTDAAAFESRKRGVLWQTL